MRATLVLDTNAWLDLLVFADPVLDGLPDAVEAGDVALVTDRRALDELERVLAYPALAVAPPRRAAILAQVRALSRDVHCPALPDLPRCRDPDD